MIAHRRVGPFADRASAELCASEPNVKRAARRVADVAYKPITASADAMGEVVAAHSLGGARKAVGKFVKVVGHQDRPRNEKGPPSLAGRGKGFCGQLYSAATARESAANGAVSPSASASAPDSDRSSD